MWHSNCILVNELTSLHFEPLLCEQQPTSYPTALFQCLSEGINMRPLRWRGGGKSVVLFECSKKECTWASMFALSFLLLFRLVFLFCFLKSLSSWCEYASSPGWYDFIWFFTSKRGILGITARPLESSSCKAAFHGNQIFNCSQMLGFGVSCNVWLCSVGRINVLLLIRDAVESLAGLRFKWMRGQMLEADD